MKSGLTCRDPGGDDQGRPQGRTGGRSQQVGVGEGVPEHPLVGGARGRPASSRRGSQGRSGAFAAARGWRHLSDRAGGRPPRKAAGGGRRPTGFCRAKWKPGPTAAATPTAASRHTIDSASSRPGKDGGGDGRLIGLHASRPAHRYHGRPELQDLFLTAIAWRKSTGCGPDREATSSSIGNAPPLRTAMRSPGPGGPTVRPTARSTGCPR